MRAATYCASLHRPRRDRDPDGGRAALMGAQPVARHCRAKFLERVAIEAESGGVIVIS